MLIRQKLFWGFVCFWMVFKGAVYATQISEIELTDGSVVSGEIISFVHETYTLQSGSLGTIKINAAQVRAITQNQKPKKAAADLPLKDLQQKMMGDVGIMSQIMSLQNDPAFQEILKDPAMMKAVNSGDINTLLNNPKFLKILDNSAVKNIQKEVGE